MNVSKELKIILKEPHFCSKNELMKLNFAGKFVDCLPAFFT